jgi:DNA-binding IclR family transcriptional regulator
LLSKKTMQNLKTASSSLKAPGSVDPASSVQLNATERSFAILEFVAGRGRPSSASEIVEALELPKASVYRLVEGLEKAGLLSTHGASRGIVPGPRLVNLSLDVLRSFTGQIPRLVLEALVREVGETCNIGTLVSNEIVYLDRVEAERWPLRLHTKAGARVPLHCSAIGKLFLAFLGEQRSLALLDRLPLTRYTDHTVTDKTALEAELADIRKEGVALDREEYLVGVTCIAAPVFGKRQSIRAGIAIQAPSARMTVADALARREPLQKAASDLSVSFENELA